MLLPVASLERRIKEHGEKNIFNSFWKCVEYKHIAFVTRSIEKYFDDGHKLRKCSKVPFPLKKIIFFIHDLLLAFWICIC